MKMTFLLSLILGTFILSGCVSSLKNEIEELKVVGGHIPDVPKIRKVPLKHYKNMSFEEFAKIFMQNHYISMLRYILYHAKQ